MTIPSWEKRNNREEIFEEKVRQLMYKRRITYQQAADLIQKGQKSIGEF